jgi:hypothetical protein
VFLVAVELLKVRHADESAVDAHQLVTLARNPGGDRLVMALATANQRSAEIEVSGAARLWGDEHLAQQQP